MTLKEQIYAALSALAGGAVFVDFAPPEIAAPYIVWSEVVDTPLNALSGISAWNLRLQVDAYAVTRSECDALADLAISALAADPIKAICISKQSFTEDAVGLKRTVVDFSIWH